MRYACVPGRCWRGCSGGRHRAFQRTARPRRTTHGLFSPVRQQISDCFPRHAEAQLHQSPKRRPTRWRLLLKGYMYSAHMANSNVQHGPGAHTGFSARFDSTYEIALDRTRAVPKHSSILFRTISLFTDLSVAFVISPRLAPKQRIIALHRWRPSHLRGARSTRICSLMSLATDTCHRRATGACRSHKINGNLEKVAGFRSAPPRAVGCKGDR